jgi:hypothetical protein
MAHEAQLFSRSASLLTLCWKRTERGHNKPEKCAKLRVPARASHGNLQSVVFLACLGRPKSKNHLYKVATTRKAKP